jgi:hypothetical protein
MKRIPLIALALAVAGIFAGLHLHSRQTGPQFSTPPVVRQLPAPALAETTVPPAPPGQRPARPLSELPLSPDALWQTPSPLAPLAAFQKWSSDYIAHSDAQKITEGVKLARERRATLRSLIKHDPEQALAHTVPEAVRRALPAEVKSLLEEKVDARGNLIVTAMSFAGGDIPKGQTAERTDAVLEDGQRLRAYVYGNREFQPSRYGVPIHGIAVDGVMAVSQWPGRILEPIEVADAKQALKSEPVCPTSGVPTAETGTEVAVQSAQQVDFYCGPAHAQKILEGAAVEEVSRPPGLGVRTAPAMNVASDAPGQTVPSFLAEGNANWTTGNKRLGIVRLTFNGQHYQNFSVADCTHIITNMGLELDEWSYGRCNIRPVSSNGSFITPELDLNSASSYDEDDIDSLWHLAETWAMVNGRPRDSYDWIMVISGDAPITDVTWAGLGRIGGPYTWLRTTETGDSVLVGLHELGHNLGLRHSSNIWPAPVLKADEEGLPFYQYGSEYGDPFDVMGRGGSLDFNVRYKVWLQWLDDANVPFAATDGRYTLREHDLEEKSGVRGLQVPFNVSGALLNTEDSLFIEYRLFDTREIISRGAQIRLGSRAKPKTYILDCTPETPNDIPLDESGLPHSGNFDSPLLVGRTFSITKYGITVHITNISADRETGELEVEINHGTPPGNNAPAGNILTNTPTGALNQYIFFAANATDADGDELAYHWQIPDANALVFENKPSAQAKFNTTGTKTIRCLVSDKHGGVTTLTKSFNVAQNSPPSISAIPDQVISEDTAVSNLAFTVGDPTTPASSLTVSAVTSSTTLFPAGSITLGGSGGNRTISLTPAANKHGQATITVTVSDGGLQDTEEFKVTVNGVTPGTTLIAAGANWRYWDAASPPHPTWKTSAFNDSSWLQNNARFVYPAPQFNVFGWTVLANPFPATRPTAYFRRTFNMPASPTGTPTIKFMCDDGLVVYANGSEIWRHNMPDGPVAHNTYASSSVQGANQTKWITVPLSFSRFQPGGSNTIAVEVHDSGNILYSGDVTFDFQLQNLMAPTVSDITDKFSPEDTQAGAYSFTAAESESPPGSLTYTATSSNQALVPDSSLTVGLNIFTLSRYVIAMPQPNATGTTEITLKVSDGGSETWEKFNLNITPVNDTPSLLPLPDMAVAMNEIAPLVEVTVSDVDDDPASLTVTATSSNAAALPNSGIQVLPGTAPNKRWLRLTPNSGIAAQSNVTVTVSDGSLSSNDVFIFRVSLPFAPTTTDVKLLQSGETWRYWPDALPLVHGQPVDFTDPALNDRAWPSGPSQLGYGNDGEATAVPVSPYRITTYFRKKFTVPSPAALSRLNLRMLRDDGAVVYLNGTQVWSSNMPRTTITSAVLAENDISGASEDAWVSTTISTAALVSGSNTIAVELHQSSMPSNFAVGDLSFDFEIDGVPAEANDTDVIVAQGEMWAYWDQSSYPDATWKLGSHSEDGWKYGLARLGYGIGGESTVVNDDNDSGAQRNPAVLFRKVFDIADPAAYTSLHLYTQRDDGIAVHLNGIRVHTEHLPSVFSLADLATSEAPAGEHTQWRHYLIDPKRLLSGRNLLAVEIHQSSLSGTDLNFDLQLIGTLSGAPQLFLTPSGPNMELAWPAVYSGWTLRGSMDMNTWTPVAEPALLDAGWIYVLTPDSGPRRFFKLIKP